MINWDWYKDVNTFKLFVHLILFANHESAGWRGVRIERGEMVTSVASLSGATGLTVRQVRTALGHLQKTGEITIETTKLFTKITVVNYSLYQGFEQLERESGDSQTADLRLISDNKQ